MHASISLCCKTLYFVSFVELICRTTWPNWLRVNFFQQTNPNRFAVGLDSVCQKTDVKNQRISIQTENEKNEDLALVCLQSVCHLYRSCAHTRQSLIKYLKVNGIFLRETTHFLCKQSISHNGSWKPWFGEKNEWLAFGLDDFERFGYPNLLWTWFGFWCLVWLLLLFAVIDVVFDGN